MYQTIGVISGKGGVGKTSLAANIGASLQKYFDKNVTLLDVSNSHLGLHFGMYGSLPRELKKTLEIDHKKNTGDFYVHPETGLKVASLLARKASNLGNFMKKISENSDIILMDCPPGLGKEAVSSVSSIDAAIVVTTPDFPSVTDAMKTLQLLDKMKKNVLGIVINKSMGGKHELAPSEIESICGRKIISVIPYDSKISIGISKGIPSVLLFPGSSSSTKFKQLAGSLVGEKYSSYGLVEMIRNFFSR